MLDQLHAAENDALHAFGKMMNAAEKPLVNIESRNWIDSVARFQKSQSLGYNRIGWPRRSPKSETKPTNFSWTNSPAFSTVQLLSRQWGPYTAARHVDSVESDDGDAVYENPEPETVRLIFEHTKILHPPSSSWNNMNKNNR